MRSARWSRPSLTQADAQIDAPHESRRRACADRGADRGQRSAMMAEAAQFNVSRGAQIIDINMGCPEKKVCKADAGSALLRDEALVARILEAVVNAVEVPVTLKTRTGWSPENRNAIRIAKIAENAGIQALTLHGRTRACDFDDGTVEYDSIRDVKANVGIPVIANGDIDSPQGESGAGLHRGRRSDDRARGARPTVDLSRYRILSRARHLCRGTTGRGRCPDGRHLQDHYALYGNDMTLAGTPKVCWGESFS